MGFKKKFDPDVRQRDSNRRKTPYITTKEFKKNVQLDFKFVERILPFLEGLYKYYFRCEVDGWENVPSEQVLFVGNHNGLLTFEVPMVFYAWWKKFGRSRATLGLAHDIALNNPFFKWLIPKLGAIPAHPELGYQALKRNYSLMVYPGGEKEAFRPYSEKARIDFFQRKGFIRLALRADVPIVPVVSIGAHESYVILHRGEEIAERLGLKDKFRLHGVPITYRALFFAWCIITGIFTLLPLALAPAAFFSIFVPLPAKMNFKILPPIYLKKLIDPELDDEANLQKIYDHVVYEMQNTLTIEYSKRKLPVVG